jgi:sporulation protein YlmC with PRC-barrel domain
MSSCSARFASILFAAAGLAVASPAIAFQESRQPEKTPRIDRNHREIKTDKLAQCDFRPHSWLSGLDVYNDKSEHIADVSDFIINRGSGRIDYVVLKTGQTMGMGGKEITMPYGSLRWDAGEERFTLSATEDQLKTYPEFTPESWAGLSDEKKTTSAKLRDWLNRDQPDWSTDPYAGSVKSGQTKTIEGEITKLEREDTDSGEQVVATVKDSSGSTHRVWLGPSWFVNGSSAAPMRGDKVTIHAYGLDRDGDSNFVGRKMTINGKDLDLRNDDGHARWGRIDRDHAKKDNRNENRDMDRVVMAESPNVTWRSVLASELKGRAVICRGQECGKVNDIIVDRGSGQVAMLSIDPNENFLGIGDTKHLVPWQVATVAVDGTLRIDASKDMVLASPAAPSDVTALNNGATASMVYKAYDIDVPSFRPVSMTGWKTDDAVTDRRMTLDNPWRKDGPIVRDINRASTVKVEGKVTEITQVTFNNGTPAAKAVRVKTDDGEKLVLLCPASHVAKSDEHCKTGAEVEISAAEVTIDGQKYLMARSVESEGKEWKLFDSNSPTWDS